MPKPTKQPPHICPSPPFWLSRDLFIQTDFLGWRGECLAEFLSWSWTQFQVHSSFGRKQWQTLEMQTKIYLGAMILSLQENFHPVGMFWFDPDLLPRLWQPDLSQLAPNQISSTVKCPVLWLQARMAENILQFSTGMSPSTQGHSDFPIQLTFPPIQLLFTPPHSARCSSSTVTHTWEPKNSISAPHRWGHMWWGGESFCSNVLFFFPAAQKMSLLCHCGLYLDPTFGSPYSVHSSWLILIPFTGSLAEVSSCFLISNSAWSLDFLQQLDPEPVLTLSCCLVWGSHHCTHHCWGPHLLIAIASEFISSVPLALLSVWG